MRSNKSVLETIPGVGRSISKDLNDLGIFEVSDLRGKNPEELYNKLCDIKKTRIDPCVLYVFRCAVYYSTNENPEKELLKWWIWKNRNI